MGIYTDAVQKAYIAYFARPADVGGLAYWESALTASKGDTSAMYKLFAAQKEYTDTYGGKDAYTVVATVYQNLFGHAPDIAGLNFWAQGLMKGDFKIDYAVTEIAKGALGSDATIYANKVAAATAFTAALDTVPEILAYQGDAANRLAKQFIANVTDDASLKAAIDTAALNVTVQGIVDNGGVGGQTYTLTPGQDIITGTDGNDVINANAFNATTGVDQTNLSVIDSIDGGNGKDTLNVEIKDAKDANNVAFTANGAFPTTIKNVEVINLNLSGYTIPAAPNNTLDASKFVGATNINQIGKALNVTKLAAGVTAGFDSIVGATALNVGASGASAAVSLKNVDDLASLTVGGTKLATVTVSGSRVDSAQDGTDAMALTVNAGTDVQTVTVTTDQKTALTINEDAVTPSVKHITNVNASASTGAITFTGSGTETTISTGSGKDTVTFNGVTSAATDTAAAVNGNVSTGAGDDTITLAVTASTGGLLTVDAGAGNDKITVNKIAGQGLKVSGGDGNDTITINGTLATTDVIDGGAGTDTVAVAGKATRVADDYIVFNKLLTGFETIKFTGATAEGALDASALAANYTTIDMNAGGIVANVGSQAVIANGAVTATTLAYGADANAPRAGSLNITEKATGTVTANGDTVTLAVKAITGAGGSVNGTLTGDLNSATISTVNSVNASSNATQDTIAKATVTAGAAAGALNKLASLTLTGNGTAVVTNTDGSKLATVDASALGGTYSLGDLTHAAGDVVTGLVYGSTSTKAETVKLGAGVDIVTIGASNYGAVDTVTGLKLVTNAAGDTLMQSSDHINVTGFAGGAKFTTTQTDLDLALKDAAVSAKGDNLVFQMGGDTYVYVDKGTLGTVDSADIVVKLTGAIDLDALLLALNTANPAG
ncbi:DUF4214 domain-containing protein [Massilia solisilvae]|uniref:DUF4214 domain-containing protein n=1 Tax=Massilia solisilvae TaxID=1811225 RepID=A0ABT2BE06_9BURK|nr:DUF4214 domain-containing protein [Massilia solisilvae]MCS0606754.1 DUF4214 domain-containing protein [Massilia solisilvae]